jgi:hypothetical protein
MPARSQGPDGRLVDGDESVKRILARAIREHATSLDLPEATRRNQVTTLLADAAPELHRLDALRISRCELEPAAIDALGRALEHLPILTDLDLGNNALGSDGLAELGRYTHRMRKLKILAVYGNGIGPVGVAGFVRTTEYLECLECFDLASNLIGDEGACLLAASAEKLPALRLLRLHGCGIGDVGVKHLIEAMRRPTWRRSLEDIGFSENPVSWQYKTLCHDPRPSSWRAHRGDAPTPTEADVRAALEDLVMCRAASVDGVSAQTSDDMGPTTNTTTSTLSVRQQWGAIGSAVFGMFGVSGGRRFAQRVESHRGYKSKTLRVIHGIMDSMEYRVRAYSQERTGAAQKQQRTRKQHAYVIETPFRDALKDPAVLAAVFRHVVLDASASEAVSSGVEDVVYCCQQCGAIHYPGSDGPGERKPSTCQSCRARRLVAEGLPHVWQYCRACDIDFKAGAAWPNAQRCSGKCPRGHNLPVLRGPSGVR